uniref:Uncharacterized membrane protein n=1 Tax=Candidatus Kentrum sp. LFY TaxID=2126342 RepID=A0A450UVH1_9GAMM|nr:MAG: Uncharacterized membrane protein [Candidatus Kentron sp. LFY]
MLCRFEHKLRRCMKKRGTFHYPIYFLLRFTIGSNFAKRSFCSANTKPCLVGLRRSFASLSVHAVCKMTHTWFLYAITAPVLWSFASILDKILISRYEIRPWIFVFLLGMSGIVAAVTVLFIHREITYSFEVIFLSGISGIVTLLYIFLFFKALATSDAPIVIALWAMESVLSVLWGHLFFSERFAWTQYLGMSITLIFITLLNMEASTTSGRTTGLPRGFGWKYLPLSRTLLFMIPVTVLSSAVIAVEKYLTNLAPVSSIFFWERIGAFLFTAVLFILFESPLIREIKKIGNKIFVILGIEMTNLLAFFSVLLALSVGSLSLVAIVLATTPLFVIFLVYLINTIRPGAVPDVASIRHFARRVFMITGSVFGVFLLLYR